MRLRELRKKAGKTVRQVAEVVGVSFQAVCQWEAGKNFPRHIHLPHLATALNCTTDDIVQATNETRPEQAA